MQFPVLKTLIPYLMIYNFNVYNIIRLIFKCVYTFIIEKKMFRLFFKGYKLAINVSCLKFNNYLSFKHKTQLNR